MEREGSELLTRDEETSTVSRSWFCGDTPESRRAGSDQERVFRS